MTRELWERAVWSAFVLALLFGVGAPSGCTSSVAKERPVESGREGGQDKGAQEQRRTEGASELPAGDGGGQPETRTPEMVGEGGDKPREEVAERPPAEAVVPEGAIDAPAPEGTVMESGPEVAPEGTRVAKCSYQTFTWKSKKRAYLLCVPSPLPGGALPLVMGFHGGGGNATQWQKALPWEKTAATHGFVMVFMQGCKDQLTDCSDANGSYLWNVGKPGEGRSEDDQGYTLAVLDRLRTIHGLTIDAKRRFATGHSLGGIFSYSLRCDKPDLFAAIGPISAVPSDETCKPHDKSSIFHVHGTLDPNLPPQTGCCSLAQQTRGTRVYLAGCATLPRCFNPTNWWPPLRSGVHPYATVTGLDAMATTGLGCRATFQETTRTQTTVCREYQGCKQGQKVEVCLIQRGDHSLRKLQQAFALPEYFWSRFQKVP